MTARGRGTPFRRRSLGAPVRHLALDPTRGTVWLAYGASPGIAARVASVRMP